MVVRLEEELGIKVGQSDWDKYVGGREGGREGGKGVMMHECLFGGVMGGRGGRDGGMEGVFSLLAFCLERE